MAFIGGEQDGEHGHPSAEARHGVPACEIIGEVENAAWHTSQPEQGIGKKVELTPAKVSQKCACPIVSG